MNHHHVRPVAHSESGILYPLAQIHLLVVEEKAVIEVADLFQNVSRDDRERARNPINIAGLIVIGPGAVRAAEGARLRKSCRKTGQSEKVVKQGWEQARGGLPGTIASDKAGAPEPNAAV